MSFYLYIFVEIKNTMINRKRIYKYLYINNMSLYFTLFTIRQLFYFTKGRSAFTKFGKRAITEHFDWDNKQ